MTESKRSKAGNEDSAYSEYYRCGEANDMKLNEKKAFVN